MFYSTVQYTIISIYFHDIPILKFTTHGTLTAPPPDPSNWIALPQDFTQVFSDWETSTVSIP
jgi:hypothetical protein